MDFLKSQFDRISQQLSALNASQRMLAGTLVVIMAMTLVWWAGFAGRAEMEAVLDHPLSGDEMAQIRARLMTAGIKTTVVGDRLMVPADRKLEAVLDLTAAQLIPGDARSALDDVLAKSNLFMSNKQHDALFLQAKQTAIAQWIMKRFPGVSHAMVIIEPRHERFPGGVQPKASVGLAMKKRGGKPDMALVEAAADLVSGAVGALDRSQVTVTIDGHSHQVRSRDNDSTPIHESTDYLEAKRQAEEYHLEKLSRSLQFIPGVLPSVSVELTWARVQKEQSTPDAKNKVQVPIREQTTTEETRSGSQTTEPGVVANAPLAVGGSENGGEHSSTITEKTETDFIGAIGKLDVRTFDPGGQSTVSAASVMVPRSHFVNSYKAINHSEPDNAVLDTFIALELAKLKTRVHRALNLPSEDAAHVDVYTDLMPMASGTAPAAASMGSVATMAMSYGKEIALGVLALVSLFMMSSLVKKASPVGAPAPAAATPTRKPLMTLGGPEEIVGEATEVGTMLDGMELDQESAKSQQMIAQVSELVGEDPDAAANLVKRWLVK